MEEKREKFYHPNFVIDDEEDNFIYEDPLSAYDTDEDIVNGLEEQTDIEGNSADTFNSSENGFSNFAEYGFSKSTLNKFDLAAKKDEILNFEEAIKTDIPFVTYEVENAAAIEDLGYSAFPMSNESLVAKSISRLMYQQNGLKGAVEYDKLLYPSERKHFTDKQKQAYQKALETYKNDYADKIIFLDRSFSPNGKQFSIDASKEYLTMYSDKFGDKFVLVVDYLQLFADRKSGMDEKYGIKATVNGLKDISYRYKIPVVCITSFNRSAYSEQLSMGSAYGSSGIEYSADYVLGIQLKGMDFIETDTKESARKLRVTKLEKEANELKKDPTNDIELELKVLKARNKSQFTVPLKAKLAYGYFQSADNEKVTPKQKSTAKNNTVVKSKNATKKPVSAQEDKTPDPFVWQ